MRASPIPVKAVPTDDDNEFWSDNTAAAYPTSAVLGPVLSKAPSGLLGLVSGVFLVIGLYCAEQNDLYTLPVVKPLNVLGTNLLPISWGLHVASWIQKKNGK